MKPSVQIPVLQKKKKKKKSQVQLAKNERKQRILKDDGCRMKTEEFSRQTLYLPLEPLS
jgi:hypothetical protein